MQNTSHDIAAFLIAMFSPALGRGGFVEVRWLTGRQLWFPLDPCGIDQASKAIERDRINACWGLGIRGRAGGGRNEDILGATTIWVDHDDDLTAWRDFPLRPSAVVNSGHGVHSYWFACLTTSRIEAGKTLAVG